MDFVAKGLPIDKELGPDGYNGFFFKKCWDIITEDVYICAGVYIITKPILKVSVTLSSL